MRNAESNYMRSNKDPVPFPRTVRTPYEVLNTSCRAGKEMPGGFIPLMPEDAVMSGSMARVIVQMEETEKLLSNAVRVKADAYFVSYAALDRFDGLDAVAFAWAQRVGAELIVEKHTVDAALVDWYGKFGEHVSVGDEVNSLYLEAYNQVVNYKRRMVSKSLDERLPTDKTLARCLWGETALARVVPDWDAGMLTASAELQFVGTQLPVKTDAVASEQISIQDVDGTDISFYSSSTTSTGIARAGIDKTGTEGVDYHRLFAQLAGGSGTVSLAAIENAKKTKAFAEMRARMSGTDEDLINLLMRGFRIPNQAYHDPILMGSATSMISQTARYATDSANLDNYVANGAGMVQLPLNLPQQQTGGVVVITYSVTPEPVFDRQYPAFLYKDFGDLPQALRDYMDEQPVQIVPNRFVDNLHSNPDTTFGFAPLNHDWSMRRIKMGARYLRTLASGASDEDQQHVWSVRQVDPVLDQDTFLVPTNLAHNVFLATLEDPFIVRVEWDAKIQGITQFGPALYESTGDYAAVASVIPDNDLTPPSEV